MAHPNPSRSIPTPSPASSPLRVFAYVPSPFHHPATRRFLSQQPAQTSLTTSTTSTHTNTPASLDNNENK